jgi:hypothetical protein
VWRIKGTAYDSYQTIRYKTNPFYAIFNFNFLQQLAAHYTMPLSRDTEVNVDNNHDNDNDKETYI